MAKSKGMGNEINPRFLKNIARGKKISFQGALCHGKRKAGIVDWRMPTDVSHESTESGSGEGGREDQTEIGVGRALSSTCSTPDNPAPLASVTPR